MSLSLGSQQRGFVELCGGVFYLRHRVYEADPETGEIQATQKRMRLGRREVLRSFAAARVIADKWLALMRAPTLVPGAQVTFRDYAAAFSERHVKLLRPSSRKKYAATLRVLNAELGADQLSAIDVPRLQLVLTRLADGRLLSTVKGFKTVALRVLTQARIDGYGAHVFPAKSLRLPRDSKAGGQRPHFKRAELDRIIASSEWPWRALWSLMGYAGLRAGEALGITWSAVDLDKLRIDVRQQTVAGVMSAPKTKASVASVPILPALAEALRAYREVWVENKAGLLFATRVGSPLSPDAVRHRVLRPLLKSLGIPKCGLHAFRHSLPAILNSIGLGPALVQRFMRHASLKQTEEYLHVSDMDVSAALIAALARQSPPQESAT